MKPVRSDRRVLLILDCSSDATRLLRTAVDLAAGIGAPVEVLLIEDPNLSRLIGPTSEDCPFFAHQVTHFSVSGTIGSGEEIGRILRIHARKIEQVVGELATRANVGHSFRLVRGLIDREIRAAADTIDLLALWGPRPSLVNDSSLVDSLRTAPLTLRMINRPSAGDRATGSRTVTSRPVTAPAIAARGVLLLSGQSPTVRPSLLQELIRQPGRQTIIFPASI